MKKNVIFAIFAFIAVIGVGIIIALSQAPEKSGNTTSEGQEKIADYCTVINSNGLEAEQGSAASEIGENEVKLTCENFKTEIEEYQGVAMVEMYSPTCVHCQKMAPVVSEIAKENVGKYKIGKLNIYAYSTLGTNYNVSSVPAFLFFKNGQEVQRLVGEQSKEKLLETLVEIAK